ncbi:MAG: cysteine desulfurase family protein [Rickettsiales bacterium]
MTVYLDHNATTPLLPSVKEAIADLMDLPLNSSAVHSYGREAKMLVEKARGMVADLIGADDRYQIIFTATGTEANNLALHGTHYNKVCSNIEHASVFNCIGQGLIPVDNHGVIKLDELEKIASSSAEKLLISLMSANNETGVIQPLKEAVAIAHKYGHLIHSDATQSIGRIDFNISELDLDMTTVSSHKMGGPFGAAALVYKKDITVTPIMHGGGQEFRIRPGTLNTRAIYGFGVAAGVAKNIIGNFEKIADLRNYLDAKIQGICPTTIIFGKEALRLPNTSSFTMPNVSNETQLIHFDINHIAISAGAACSSGKIDLPRVQMSMGYSEEVARTSIRVSMGYNTSKADVDKFIATWNELYTKNNMLEAA